MRTELGKIKKVKFGAGGYQDAMTGFSFELGGDSWGVNDFWGHWLEPKFAPDMAAVIVKVRRILIEAKVDDITKLEGIPVEVTFNGMMLDSWRVLKEVL